MMKLIAFQVHERRHDIMNQPYTWKMFQQTLVSIHHYLRFRNLHRKKCNWSILQNDNNRLVSVILEGSDGKRDHAITLVGDLLFDSNFEFAVTLCKDTLDLCCSTDIQDNEFVRDVAACDFPQVQHFAKVSYAMEKSKQFQKSNSSLTQMYSA